jgi:hypothetical protein
LFFRDSPVLLLRFTSDGDPPTSASQVAEITSTYLGVLIYSGLLVVHIWPKPSLHLCPGPLWHKLHCPFRADLPNRFKDKIIENFIVQSC